MQATAKQRALVICPGRGTYNKTELGYLKTYHSDKKSFLTQIDQYRAAQGQQGVTELDAAQLYKGALHTRGDNASALIYACALADFSVINRNKYDIVGITGNSMGWYLALACANAFSADNAIRVVNTMGSVMHAEAEGGQVVYPLVDESWQPDAGLIESVTTLLADAAQSDAGKIYTSIRLGGMIVFAADNKGVKYLLENLPRVQERYPFALPNHGGFHSPLMRDISTKAKLTLSCALMRAPEIPLIDGTGHIWQPYSTNLQDLHDYTFGHQITETYDYSCAIEVSIKEFAPDVLIILGPGATLGAPTAQILIQQNWLGLQTKEVFKERQTTQPFILSMGIDDQRSQVI